MVPLAGVVEPLRRATREIARAQGKDVRFEVVGQETELDRGVLDRLGDPLLHLVRNAVDHGIEAPGDRPPEKGDPTLLLRAESVGPNAVLTISDDGRGIDTRRVRAAASSRSVSDPTELAMFNR